MMFDDDAGATDPSGLEPCEFPQSGDSMAATRNASGPGLPPELDGSILLSHLPVNLTEMRERLLILGCTHTHGASPPGIVAARTHGEGRTQATDAMGPYCCHIRGT